MQYNYQIKPLEHPVLPDRHGFYGQYGGQFIPEILRPNIVELEHAFNQIITDKNFWQEFITELHQFSGRPTPITHAANLSKVIGGANIYLKREDLNQTGAHKINNVIGQGLLMKRLGKQRVIAETGAGQHGVATATMAARLGFEACIYMGAEDVARQRPNVFWMEKLGATVVPVEDGSRTLKDAIDQAMRDWLSNFTTTHYLLGTVCGPHPFPAMVSYFQSVVGIEAREQMLQLAGKLPDRVYACVGGGSNAMAIFQGFLEDDVELIGVEAGGLSDQVSQHAARLATHQGKPGIAQGYKTEFLQNDDGQLIDTYSVAAGLDYVGVSPILAHWAQTGKMRAMLARDAQVLEAVKLLIKHEGIIPALESAHGIAGALAEAATMSSNETVLINLSGRGDKDIFTIANALGDASWHEFLQQQATVGVA